MKRRSSVPPEARNARRSSADAVPRGRRSIREVSRRIVRPEAKSAPLARRYAARTAAR